MKSIKIAVRIAIVLAMITVLGVVCTANALAKDDILRGTWDNFSWELNMTGELVIQGEGDMEVFSAHGTPEWRNYRDRIRSVTIGEGVTGIGYSAFSGCENLTQITFPNTVTSLGDYAFAYCTSLTEIVLPPALITLERYTFYDCVNLEKMTVPSSLKNFYNPISFNCSHNLTILFLGCETRWIWIAESVPQYVTVTFLEHDFSILKTFTEEKHTRTCVYCYNSRLEGHHWNEGEITSPPTHLAKGVKTYTCMECAATRTEGMEKLAEHKWEDWIPHDDRQHKRACICGEIEYADHHSGNGNGCPDCGTAEQDLAPNFRAKRQKRADDPFGCVASGVSPVFFALSLLSALALVRKKRREW